MGALNSTGKILRRINEVVKRSEENKKPGIE